ncbi:AraC family transcriptional regulator [Streptomyces arenae]|nr:AraC family transcriptional regulator [Streptomyces arenae]
MDDPLSDLLSRVRGRGAVLSRAAHGQQWGVRQLDPAASLTLVVPVRGTCWVAVDDEPEPGVTPVGGAERKPLLIGTGEAALIAGPRPYTLGHAPDAEPELVVHGPGRYSDAAGHPSTGPEITGVRTCGYPDQPGTSLIVTGSYPHAGAVDARLLQALPPLLRVRSDELPRPVVELLTEEVAVAAPGQQAVLDRLLDLTLVRVLRAVFARPDAPAPRWWTARTDPVAGPALRALHAHPERPWTVEVLARAAGVSRATLTRRFGDLLGSSPMAYLAEWRMSLAADLLDAPDTTVAAAARAIGYRDEFAFSTAFKRHRGTTPTEHRARTGGRRDAG